ncbi:plastocyanin [[Limnothrix rosea] IAM M-220]|uniref:plastocyanin n=1 Tax=[Limnothrix rosea] IAM M-220 TaxID=454133 RepID=UPI00095DFCD6|nr:plastocyanin [[Limnothrix rosea] IAM M-220]OKH20056.1 plastocyanin [[Limnothrix rosea] IAM M-220]
MKRLSLLGKRLAMMVAAVACIFGLFSPTALAEDHIIKMGADNGMLAFQPAQLSVKAGDTITWVNNKVFPHNVVFDANSNPGGAELAESLSQPKLMMTPNQEYAITIPADAPAGDYSYYCQPHRGAGMVGKITVQ